ncbi:hypothetical protein ROA7450_01001 [Roseovarius albus]|uniref:Uncharacterized protein n=1 Tax=Roseovarius albus TaxID=1247867 RepID=A0A1X6YL67_9RHOB|nr:hypothetical protein ROA7450_01001 [Roseovarius albus]
MMGKVRTTCTSCTGGLYKTPVAMLGTVKLCACGAQVFSLSAFGLRLGFAPGGGIYGQMKRAG